MRVRVDKGFREFCWKWQVRRAPSSWFHSFKGAHSGKERVTWGRGEKLAIMQSGLIH